MNDNRNMILAIILSMVVLFGWQYFVAGPQLEQTQEDAVTTQQSEEAEAADQSADLATPEGGSAQSTGNAGGADIPGSSSQTFATREAAIAGQPRIAVDTESLTGSINLVGGRIDDLRLKKYHLTPDTSSDIITLFSPAGTPEPYFIEQGWAVASGQEDIDVPDGQTQWSAPEDATLTAETPVTLTYETDGGLVFERTISVDENYMFEVTQTVTNTGESDVALYPYARVARHYTPDTQNFFILHEGGIGVLGEDLIEIGYSDLVDEPTRDFTSTGGWMGFTDKYWAASVIPEQDEAVNARYSYAERNGDPVYQSSFVTQDPITVGAGETAEHTSLAFAGAKVESIIDSYENTYGIDRFELLIDWGWLHFITKPMFFVIMFLYGLLGNFGLAILAVTVIIKAIFFPLANKSYASMANMRRVQPEMKAIQERHKDDRAGQQQAMMELYKKEKINPLSGCWPILIQIPVFFSLYKVLFVTIEMRHAPFFGWIEDLASPDPTNIFTLFGLIPWDPTIIPVLGAFLTIGIWPLIMGITMFVQMKLNPPPPDPTQAMIFTFMPIVFTFMLSNFPAGLVIYWAWNNFLSVVQQWVIMKRHGVEVNILGNIKDSFKRKPKPEETTSK